MTEDASGPSPTVLGLALSALGDRVLSSHERLGDATVVIAAEHRAEAAHILRTAAELYMDMLMDSTVVDYLGDELRFEVVDHFFSSRHHHRVRLKCRVDEDAPTVPSLTPQYGSANWMERESFDLYGVQFDGHPDLRRILLYDEFQGHPLRKDYDKLQAWPLFEERYEGIRETSTIIHPAPGDQEPQHEP